MIFIFSAIKYLCVNAASRILILFTLNDTGLVVAGNVIFTLDFSESMNSSVAPTVQIKNSSTYSITAIGWSNSTRWWVGTTSQQKMETTQLILSFPKAATRTMKGLLIVFVFIRRRN